MKIKFILLYFLIAFLFIPLASADVISVNSGGDDRLIINPDSYLEGFFFSTSSDYEYCGDNIKNGLDVCDGTDLDSRTCATQGFTGGTLSCAADCSGFITSACTSDAGGDTGGGGAGGGVPSYNISISPTEIERYMEINTPGTRSFLAALTKKKKSRKFKNDS